MKPGYHFQRKELQESAPKFLILPLEEGQKIKLARRKILYTIGQHNDPWFNHFELFLESS